MNILLDFLTFKWRTGAGEYARRVYYTLFERISNEHLEGTHIFAIYDSTDGIVYEDMQEGSDITEDVTYCDTNKTPITQIVKENKIDILFIACAQYFEKQKGVADVKCRTICVIHDLAYEELFGNTLEYYFKLLNPKYQLNGRQVSKRKYFFDTMKIANWFIRTRKNHTMENNLDMLNPVLKLLENNDDAKLVTVSEYTRNCLLYQYGISSEQIKVLYSPERIFVNASERVENRDLAELIHGGKKYFLMLSANRNTKNPHKAVQAFKRFAELYNDTYFVVLGYPEKVFERMFNPAYLSDSDLALALQNCYALVYPTFFEGFGYPAIEAMHYGKPVLVSNVTSLPEVLGDAPVWFSPLYETEIFNALAKLTDDNYDFFSSKSKMQYAKVRTKQEHDLKELINLILGE